MQIIDDDENTNILETWSRALALPVAPSLVMRHSPAELLGINFFFCFIYHLAYLGRVYFQGICWGEWTLLGFWCWKAEEACPMLSENSGWGTGIPKLLWLETAGTENPLIWRPLQSWLPDTAGPALQDLLPRDLRQVHPTGTLSIRRLASRELEECRVWYSCSVMIPAGSPSLRTESVSWVSPAPSRGPPLPSLGKVAPKTCPVRSDASPSRFKDRTVSQ